MTTLRQAAEEALNALEFCAGTSYITDAHDIAEEAIIQLSKALAEPEPQYQWIELTDDELSALFAKIGWVEENNNLRDLGFYRHARAIEKKLKEKNHGQS